MKVTLEIIFSIYLLLTIGGALAAVLVKSLVRALVALVGCMVGIAGLYLYLNSPFLAFMQILIYVGAVCIMIFFAIMLAEPPGAKDELKTKRWFQVVLACIAAVLPLGVLWRVLNHSQLSGAWILKSTDLVKIGKDFLLQYSLVFELISLVLFVAIIGSVLIARLKGGEYDG